MSFSWDLSNLAGRAVEALNRAANSPVVRGMAAYYRGLTVGAEVFAKLMPLGRNGWALSTYGALMTAEAHYCAAAVVEADPSAAAQHLEDGWSHPAARQEACNLVLYVYPPEQREIAARRKALLERASAHFDGGCYEEAVLLVYSQLDGLFRDVAEVREAAFKRLFSHAKVTGPHGEVVRQFEELVTESDTMIGTEREFFLAVREGMTENVGWTTLGDHPSRHGVLHGRVLGYGTRRRAAQTFAFLAACLELLVAAWGDELPLTEEEADSLAGEMSPGLTFILAATLAQPVRAIYLANVRNGKDLLVAEEVGRTAGDGADPGQAGGPASVR